MKWQLSQKVSPPSGRVTCVAVDPYGECFATGSTDGIISLWDLEMGTFKYCFHAHYGCIHDMVMSEQSPVFYTCGDDWEIKCWDMSYPIELNCFKGHVSQVWSVALHSSYDILVSGGRDWRSLIWDRRTDKHVRSLCDHEGSISKTLISSYKGQVITTSLDESIKVWDIVAAKPVYTLRHHKESALDLALSLEENLLVSAGSDSLTEWRYPEGDFCKRFTKASANCIAVNTEGLLASGSSTGTLHFWNWNRRNRCYEETSLFSLESGSGICSMAFDKSGRKLITTDIENNIKIYTCVGY